MDTKILYAILISATLGATIGFAANYAVLSMPIQSLRHELDQAKDDIQDIDSNVDGVESDVASLQDDLSSAQSSLTALTSKVNAFDSREWHEVRSVGGSSSMVTGIFELKGQMLKVSWLFSGLSTDAWIGINLRFANGTIYWTNGSSGVYGAFDAEGDILQTGLYYLDVSSYNAEVWVVAVYDYY